MAWVPMNARDARRRDKMLVERGLLEDLADSLERCSCGALATCQVRGQHGKYGYCDADACRSRAADQRAWGRPLDASDDLEHADAIRALQILLTGSEIGEAS